MKARVVINVEDLRRLESQALSAYPSETFSILTGYVRLVKGSIEASIVGFTSEGRYYKILQADTDHVIFRIARKALLIPAHAGIWHTHPLQPLNGIPPALVHSKLKEASSLSPQDEALVVKVASDAGRPIVAGVTAVTKASWGLQFYTSFYITLSQRVIKAKLEAAPYVKPEALRGRN
ncbi:MAG: hypothetical protein GSR85_01250 [Desulfurococcales archaeon]|nr:hypothetical protein [Desulfurococcales archaeon]